MNGMEREVTKVGLAVSLLRLSLLKCYTAPGGVMRTSPSKQRLIIINASFPLSCLVKPNFSCFSAPEANFLTAMSHERCDVS